MIANVLSYIAHGPVSNSAPKYVKFTINYILTIDVKITIFM